MLDGTSPCRRPARCRSGIIVVPAPRGLVLDAKGRVLIGNRSTHVVTVDRQSVLAQPDGGADGAGPARLRLLGTPAADLAHEITPCGTDVPDPCWTGQPYQPVPVATGDRRPGAAGAERAPRGLSRACASSTQTVRDYPGGAGRRRCSATPGRSAPPTRRPTRRSRRRLIGRSGLESPTTTRCAASTAPRPSTSTPRATSSGAGRTVDATPRRHAGHQSIDLDVQKLAEKSLRRADRGDPGQAASRPPAARSS